MGRLLIQAPPYPSWGDDGTNLSLTPKARGEQRDAGLGEIYPPPSAHHASHTAKFAQALIPLCCTPKYRAFGATGNEGTWSGASPQFKGFIRGQDFSPV